MARSSSPSLSLARCRLAATYLLPSSRTIFFRSQSSNRRSSRGGGELYEIDTAASQSQSDPLFQKLEDAVHRIMVRRAAPDWLPFVPGASYWVPPPRSQSHGIAKLVEKLANPIGDEESISISSGRGWPSSDYFIKGVQPQSVETEVASNTASHSEDEEGLSKICRDFKNTNQRRFEPPRAAVKTRHGLDFKIG